VDGYIAAIRPTQPRKQFLHAYKSEGKTKYKPNNRKSERFSMSLIDKKAIEMFRKIDTVHGHCENCDEDAILVAIVSEYYRCTNCGHDTRQHVNGSIRYMQLTESDKAFIKKHG